jgi:two-component system, cell cycle sensor histidine kinase PleC
VLFILTIGSAGIVQSIANRDEIIADARADLTLLTSAIADRIELRVDAIVRAHQSTDEKPDGQLSRDAQALANDMPPLGSQSAGRQVYIVDRSGQIIATRPFLPGLAGKPFESVLPSLRMPPIPGAQTGDAHVPTSPLLLADSKDNLVAARDLPAPFGRVYLTQPRATALDVWKSDTVLAVTLFATTASVLLILGFAFHWQSARAREADSIYADVANRFDTALSRGRCGLWDWDVARGTIYWSDSMHELIGRAPAGRLMTFAEVNALMHPDDVSLFRIAVDVAEGVLDVIDHEFRMRHADGSYVWLRARAELVQNPGTPGPHLIGIALDVTEQKALASARTSADHRLRLAIESASEAFVLRDADDRLIAWNAKFASTWRFPDGMLHVGADYRTVAEHIDIHTLRTETSWDGPSPAGARSYEIELVDGRWLKVNERRTVEGGAVSVASDITALKQHEATLIDKERHLLATVADLQTSRQTLEYQAQQLAELAEKYADEKIRAEDASRAKSDFIALMSHELRTPLNAIIGFAQIMKAGTFGPLGAGKYHEYCDDIAESGETLLAIVNDILQMSSIESGRLQLDRKPMHLCVILDETMRAVASEADRKHVTMQVQSAGHAPIVADPRAMRQILLNLVSNAVKFTPDGGRVVARLKTGTQSIRLVIGDSGIGISREAMTRIGQPFGQAEGTFTRRHGGSGLGLAIARSLAEMHGGTMRIRSAIGSGTTVIVDLPRNDFSGATFDSRTRH